MFAAFLYIELTFNAPRNSQREYDFIFNLSELFFLHWVLMFPFRFSVEHIKNLVGVGQIHARHWHIQKLVFLHRHIVPLKQMF